MQSDRACVCLAPEWHVFKTKPTKNNLSKQIPSETIFRSHELQKEMTKMFILSGLAECVQMWESHIGQGETLCSKADDLLFTQELPSLYDARQFCLV